MWQAAQQSSSTFQQRRNTFIILLWLCFPPGWKKKTSWKLKSDIPKFSSVCLSCFCPVDPRPPTPNPSESAWFTYTRLSSKSDIQDQSGHPREPQPAERLSEPPFATLIFKPLLHCQLTSPSNGTGRYETELFLPSRFPPLHQFTLWGTIHRHPPCARQLQTLAQWITFPDFSETRL